MPFKIKILFTIVMFVFGVCVCFLDSGKNSAGPDWMWRLGNKDPFRKLFFRPDGSIKRFTKTSVLIFYLVILAIIWIVVPIEG